MPHRHEMCVVTAWRCFSLIHSNCFRRSRLRMQQSSPDQTIIYDNNIYFSDIVYQHQAAIHITILFKIRASSVHIFIFILYLDEDDEREGGKWRGMPNSTVNLALISFLCNWKEAVPSYCFGWKGIDQWDVTRHTRSNAHRRRLLCVL